MKLFYEFNQGVFQVYPEIRDSKAYQTVEVWFADNNPVQSPDTGVRLYSGLPSDLYIIPYRLRTDMVGSIWVVGITHAGPYEVLGVLPLRKQVHFNNFYDNMNRGLKERKRWFEKLRHEEVNVYWKTFGTTCSCWNNLRKQANPSCELCGGTGKTQEYLGSRFKMMLQEEYQRITSAEESGRITTQKMPGWFFGFPYVTDGCIVQRQNGDNLVIQNTEYKFLGGDLIEQSFELVLFPDTFGFRYTTIEGAPWN